MEDEDINFKLQILDEDEEFLMRELNKIIKNELICAATAPAAAHDISSESDAIEKSPKTAATTDSEGQGSSRSNSEQRKRKRKSIHRRRYVSLESVCEQEHPNLKAATGKDCSPSPEPKNKKSCLQRYLDKQTSLKNPHMSKKVKDDLAAMFVMRNSFVSNVTLSNAEMESISDKWLDTYAFRFYELHNVQRLKISDYIKMFPGYCYYPLLAEDFLRDTKMDLKDLDGVDWETGIKLGCSSEILNSIEPCKKAIESWSETPVDAAVLRNVGMILLVHEMLTTDKVEKLVVVVESLTQIQDSFGKDFPTIVIFTASYDFCRAKDIFVYFDNAVVGKVSDFYEAVIMCYALYYIFWTDYDPVTAPLFRKLDAILKMPEYTGYMP